MFVDPIDNFRLPGLTEPQQIILTLVEDLGSGEEEKIIETLNIIDTTSQPVQAHKFQQKVLGDFHDIDFSKLKFEKKTISIAENPSKPQNDSVSSQYLTTSDKKDQEAIEINLYKINGDVWKMDYFSYGKILFLAFDDPKMFSKYAVQPASQVDWKDIDVTIIQE